LVRLLWLQFYLNCSNHFEKERAHIANLQCGQTYFNNALESVEEKDWGISNDGPFTLSNDEPLMTNLSLFGKVFP
jgi:hypothetical protein